MKKARLLHHRAVVTTQKFVCGEDDGDLEKGMAVDGLKTGLLMPDSKYCKERRPSILVRLLRRILILLTLICISAALYWFALYTGIYSRDAATCPIQEWTYEPWCGDALTHQNTSHLPSVLSPEQWYDLREKYQTAAGERHSTLASNWGDLYKQLPAPYNSNHPKVPNSGYLIPMEIRVTPDKGRGVFTTVDIKKGQKIWDNRFQATFPNDCSSKIFYSQLTNEQACDTMFWSYAHNFFGEGYQTVLDLDGHGYTNHGTQEDGLENVVHHFDNEMETSYYSLWPIIGRLSPTVKATRRRPGAHGLYAIRDISAGEELFFDYHKINTNAAFDWHSILFTRSLPMKYWFIL